MIGRNKLYNDDCIKGMSDLYDKYGECIDLCITDPPYGIEYQSNGSHKKKDRIHNDDQIDYRTFAELVFKLLKPNTHAYFFTRFDVYPEHYKQLADIGFNIKSLIVGDKLHVGGMGDLKGSFSNNMELVIFAHKGRRVFNETELIKNKKKAGRKLSRYHNPTSEYKKRLPMLWKTEEGYPEVVQNSAKNKDNPHPTPKNPKFIEWLIQLSSNEGDLVLDPFMGSSSTALACINTQRSFIGYEISKEYYDYSISRLQNIG